MKLLQRLLSLLLSLSLIMLPMVPVKAAMIGNGEIFGSTSADRTLLVEAMQKDTVVQQLSALGISQEQAMERIARLTDQEVAHLNQQLADLPAGGDVLGILVLLFIVFIVTDMLGATDIFPFVHPIKR
jgi:hypothetical protein